MRPDPTINLADNTYTRGRTKDIKERREFGWLQGYTSNTVGNHYLRLTMIEPRKKTEWAWEQHLKALGKREENTVVGIRLHAGQVKQLRNFLNTWLRAHYQQGEYSR